jgi:hypothetical protein
MGLQSCRDGSEGEVDGRRKILLVGLRRIQTGSMELQVLHPARRGDKFIVRGAGEAARRAVEESVKNLGFTACNLFIFPGY